MMAVENDQLMHLNDIADDPVKMWTKLSSIHNSQKAGNRFNAYNDLLSIRKQDDESLT